MKSETRLLGTFKAKDDAGTEHVMAVYQRFDNVAYFDQPPEWVEGIKTIIHLSTKSPVNRLNDGRLQIPGFGGPGPIFVPEPTPLLD